MKRDRLETIHWPRKKDCSGVHLGKDSAGCLWEIPHACSPGTFCRPCRCFPLCSVRPMRRVRFLRERGPSRSRSALLQVSWSQAAKGGNPARWAQASGERGRRCWPARGSGRPGAESPDPGVQYTDEPKMPPAGKLPDHAIDALKQWVKKGAPWPAEKARGGTIEDHWAFRPVRAPFVPTVHASDWPVTEIDRFILARLEARKLSPSPTADRRTLIRRITFDLTGLPPTEHEVEAFERDQAPGAYAILVDRLLASKQFGERWARHWLDVARYADSKGPSANDQNG